MVDTFRAGWFSHRNYSRGIVMSSKASIGGHPLHPMLIPFPIALLVFSLVADIVYLWSQNPVWRDYVAFYTLLGGIVGGVAAAIPGLVDWSALKDPETIIIANWHARANILTLLIFIASFLLRTSRGESFISDMPMIPVVLSVAGVIGLAVAGWLGGELVFRRGVGVNRESNDQAPTRESSKHARAA